MITLSLHSSLMQDTGSTGAQTRISGTNTKISDTKKATENFLPTVVCKFSASLNQKDKSCELLVSKYIAINVHIF